MIMSENATRKLDNLGRLTIPKFIRDRHCIKEGDELSFYTIQEKGKIFIGINSAKIVDPRYHVAEQVLEELGAEIPIELEEALNVND